MTTQSEIIAELGISKSFDASTEVRHRVDFLATYLRNSGLGAYVLGISGGVDSLTAAMLAQRAVGELRAGGYEARFIAVRLPYGIQADEDDAENAIEAIGADQVHRIDIKPAVDAMHASVREGEADMGNAALRDFLLGNIKARQRMIAQYAIAGACQGLVIGTDHAAEALMGFFTKFGDGAADIVPLAGLNKRRVRALAGYLGAPPCLVGKVPTADLEDLRPLRPDEEAYGVTYEQIDDYLEGMSIDPSAERRILQAHERSRHKRALPVAPSSEHSPS